MGAKKTLSFLLIIFLGITLTSCGSPQKKKPSRKSSYRSSYKSKSKYRRSRRSRYRRAPSLSYSKSTTGTLIYNLKSYQTNKRTAAARQLGNRKDKDGKVSAALAYAMSDNNVYVRKAAYTSLKKLGQGKTAEALSRSYNKRNPDHSRALATKDPLILKIYYKNISRMRTNYAGPSARGIALILKDKETARGFGVTGDAYEKEVKKHAAALIKIRLKLSYKKWTKKAVLQALLDLGEPAHLLAIRELTSYNSKKTVDLRALVLNNPEVFKPAFTTIAGLKYHPAMKQTLGILPDFPDSSLNSKFLRRIESGSIPPSSEVTRFLGRTASPRSRVILENYLSTAPTLQKVEAITELGNIGSPASIPLLVTYLSHSDYFLRGKAAMALGFMDDRRAIPPLIRQMEKETKAQVTAYIFISLARYNVRRAVPAMIRAAEKNSTLAPKLARAIAIMPDRRFLPFIERELKKIGAARASKIKPYREALTSMGPSAIPLCKRIIAGPKHTLTAKETAIEVLGKIGRKKDIYFLKQHLAKNRFKSFSKKYLKALGRIGALEAIPTILEKSVSNSDAARKALAMMGKPAIPRLKYFAKKGKTSSIKKTAALALYDIYNAYASYSSGIKLLKLKDYLQAKLAFIKAVNTKNNFHEAKLNLGVSEYYLGNYSQANKYFKDVSALYPKLRAQANLNLGASHQESYSTGKARYHTARALKLKRNYTSAYYNHGWLDDEKGKLKPAAENLNRAMRLSSRHVKAVITQAGVIAKSGNYRRALALLKNAESKLTGEDRDLLKIIEKNRNDWEKEVK